ASEDGTVRQSGELSFRLGNVAADAALLTAASSDAATVADADPTLAAHPALRARVCVATENLVS
ncbi:MAG: hypothetical protein II955_03145, partial [Clostridia bacterium]|nr:hypothetical protein [Clostridia bacterium]